MKRTRRKSASVSTQDNLNKRLRTRDERAEARNRCADVESRSQTSNKTSRVTGTVDEDQEISSLAGSVSYAQHAAGSFSTRLPTSSVRLT